MSKNHTSQGTEPNSDMFTVSESMHETDGSINDKHNEIKDDYNVYRLMLRTAYIANYRIPLFEVIIIGVLILSIAIIAILNSVLTQSDLVVEFEININVIEALLFLIVLDFFTDKLSEFIISGFIRKHHRHESFRKEYNHNKDFRKAVKRTAYNTGSNHVDMIQPSYETIRNMLIIIGHMGTETIDSSNMGIIRKFKSFIKTMHENNELNDNNIRVIANILARIIIPTDTIDRTQSLILLHDMYSKK